MRARGPSRTLRAMFSPMLTKLMNEARIDDLRRKAAHAARLREVDAPSQPAAEAADVTITIRPALPSDSVSLARLADLDSAPMPVGAVLIAEANGQLRAAVSLCDGVSLADPFHPTAATVQLLLARAAQLCGRRRRRDRSALALRGVPPGTALADPAQTTSTP